nr:YSC84-related protein [Piscinibacter sp. XHJ-5]
MLRAEEVLDAGAFDRHLLVRDLRVEGGREIERSTDTDLCRWMEAHGATRRHRSRLTTGNLDMNKRFFLALGSLAILSAACTTPDPQMRVDPAIKRRSIDADVDSALAKLHLQVPGSRELTAKANGVLVFPSVFSAGLFISGSYGQGALRTGGRTEAYYSTTAASVGLLAGADTKTVVLLFMNQGSLDKFRASRGWTVGADASVTLIEVAADASVDTRTAQHPVVGYVLNNAGLMGSLSVDGTKISKLEL